MVGKELRLLEFQFRALHTLALPFAVAGEEEVAVVASVQAEV